MKIISLVLTVWITPLLCLPAATVDFVKGKATAAVGTQLPDGATFGTAARSISQVGMDKSFFRVGSDSQVKLGEGRRIALEKGVMLVGSEPGGRRREIEVEAPGYRLKVKGTVQVAYYPGQYLKIIVLEGTVTVALQSLTGEFETLEPGQMLIINPSDKRLPEPVEVDLTRLVATSQLVNASFGMPSTKGLMDAAAATQGNDYRVGDIARTPFLLRGASPELSLVRQRQPAPAQSTPPAAASTQSFLVDNAAGGNLLPEEITVFQVVDDLSDPTATVDQKTYSDGVVALFNTFPFPASSSNITLTRSGARTKELAIYLTSEVDDFGNYSGPAVIHGTIRADADIFGSVAGKLLTFESQEYGADPFHDFSLHVAPGTDILTPPGVGLRLHGAVGITIEGATLQTGATTHPDEIIDLRVSEASISITNSVLSGNSINAAGSTLSVWGDQAITTNAATLSARNNITLGQPTSRSIVTLQNSSQLAALVGSITVQSKGGPITVDTSTLTAGNTITLDALDIYDAFADGLVTLRNATMSAAVIRARGSTPGGDALLIDGGTFNASSMLKFYAEGASTLRFRNHVTVNTPRAIFAGSTVRVDAGGSVSVSGRADVHADSHQYNTIGTGTISAGGGLNQSTRVTRPAFEQ